MWMYLMQYRSRVIVVLLLLVTAGYGLWKSQNGQEVWLGKSAVNEQMKELLGDATPSASPTPKPTPTPGSAAPVAVQKNEGIAAEGTPSSRPETSAPAAAEKADVQQAEIPTAGTGERGQAPAKQAVPRLQRAEPGKIDLNSATLEQLVDLPHIGESKAKAIIAYREQHGGFGSIEEILNVKGIGPKTFAAFKDKVTVRPR